MNSTVAPLQRFNINLGGVAKVFVSFGLNLYISATEIYLGAYGVREPPGFP